MLDGVAREHHNEQSLYWFTDNFSTANSDSSLLLKKAHSSLTYARLLKKVLSVKLIDLLTRGMVVLLCNPSIREVERKMGSSRLA